MAAIKGRNIVVYLGGVAIAGVRTKSIKINGSSIDITNDDDAAVRKLMDEPGQVDVAISVSGVVISPDVLRNLALNVSDRVNAMAFSYGGSPNTGFSGSFFMGPYSENGEYQGAAMFEAEFQSAGAVAYNA